MTDMAAVAALPRGPELVALAVQTNGDPAGIRAIATRWRNAATSSAEPFSLLNSAVSQVDVAWKGASADAFVAYMKRYDSAGNALRGALGDCAGSLESAAGAVESAKQKVGQMCDDLLTWVAQCRQMNPQATEDQLKAAIEEQVVAAKDFVQGQVDAAVAALATATSDLGKHLGDAAPMFDGIPAAGDQTFVPGPGHATQWVPVPEDEIRTTELAGADEGPQGDGGAGASGNGGSSSGGSSGGGGSGGGSGGGGAAGAIAGGGGGGAGRTVPFTVTGSGTGADIVKAARAHLNAPYVWGADGPDAFDCSGLVHVALNEAGIEIGDTTAAGYQASGKPITGEPQPGDIVFFGDPPSHCGIYIGDGRMIAAPQEGDVVKEQAVVGTPPITYRRFA